jgi:hypothetical protein
MNPRDHRKHRRNASNLPGVAGVEMTDMTAASSHPSSPDHSPTRVSGDSSPSHHSSDSSVAFSSNLPEGLREEHATVEGFKASWNKDPDNMKHLTAVMVNAFNAALTLRFGLDNCIINKKRGREITVQLAQWYLQNTARLKTSSIACVIGLCAMADCYNIGLPVPGTALANLEESKKDKARALELFKEAYALVRRHNLNLLFQEVYDLVGRHDRHLLYAVYTCGKYSTNAEEAKPYLEEAVKQDYVFAQGALAYRLHSKENPSNADFMRAEELAQAAAESGDAFGKAKLATLLKWRADRIQKENPNEAAGLRTKVTIWHVRARTQGQEMNNEFFNRFTAAYPAPVLTGCMILRRERYDVDSTISTIEAQHPEAAKQVYEAFTSQSTTTAEERAWLQGRIADLNKLKGSSKPSKHGYFGRNKPHKHDSHAASHSAGKHKQSGCGGGCNIM